MATQNKLFWTKTDFCAQLRRATQLYSPHPRRIFWQRAISFTPNLANSKMHRATQLLYFRRQHLRSQNFLRPQTKFLCTPHQNVSNLSLNSFVLNRAKNCCNCALKTLPKFSRPSVKKLNNSLFKKK